MARAERIEKLLRAKFIPHELQIHDDSDRHSGHSGARPEGETHFRIAMTAPSFSGLSRLERHRLVNSALQQEFETGLHAVQLVLKAPKE